MNRSWNSISRTSPCGLVAFDEQAHDLVLRRNMRVALLPAARGSSIEEFAHSTYGCHHIFLVMEITRLWNELMMGTDQPLGLRPTLKVAKSGEVFGLLPAVLDTMDNLEISADVVLGSVEPDEIKFSQLSLFEDQGVDPLVSNDPTSTPSSRSTSVSVAPSDGLVANQICTFYDLPHNMYLIETILGSTKYLLPKESEERLKKSITGGPAMLLTHPTLAYQSLSHLPRSEGQILMSQSSLHHLP